MLTRYHAAHSQEKIVVTVKRSWHFLWRCVGKKWTVGGLSSTPQCVLEAILAEKEQNVVVEPVSQCHMVEMLTAASKLHSIECRATSICLWRSYAL